MNLEQIVLSGAGFFAAFYLKSLADSSKEVSRSIKELNERVATVIERTETHAAEIQNLRLRQDDLIVDVARLSILAPKP